MFFILFCSLYIIFEVLLHHSEILWITSVFQSSNLRFHYFCNKTGHFWPFLGIFSEPSHFLPLKEHLLTKKWSGIQNYIYISFKRSKNEVKRTFLAPSKNYHASTSAKINQVLEVCPTNFFTRLDHKKITWGWLNAI